MIFVNIRCCPSSRRNPKWVPSHNSTELQSIHLKIINSALVSWFTRTTSWFKRWKSISSVCSIQLRSWRSFYRAVGTMISANGRYFNRVQFDKSSLFAFSCLAWAGFWVLQHVVRRWDSTRENLSSRSGKKTNFSGKSKCLHTVHTQWYSKHWRVIK